MEFHLLDKREDVVTVMESPSYSHDEVRDDDERTRHDRSQTIVMFAPSASMVLSGRSAD
jgi:hypothetical protein